MNNFKMRMMKQLTQFYSDGQPISPNLTIQGYKLAVPDKRCKTCVAFVPARDNVVYFSGGTLPFCSAWKETVDPEYVCDSWSD